MTTTKTFNWQKPVPKELQIGSRFDIWEEEKGEVFYEPNVEVRVDEFGFYLYWKPEGKDGQVLEITHVSDIYTKETPKDVKLLTELQTRNYGKGLEELSLTIVSGLDLVNLNYLHMVAQSVDVVKTWQAGLRSITNNNKAKNICPMTMLKKQWIRLSFLTDSSGQIPVKTVVRTFAWGNAERGVHIGLKDVGLPYKENDTIPLSDWTFEKFYQFYHKICPRSDIDRLFNMISLGKSYMCPSQMVKFLNEKQRDPRLNEILLPHHDEKSVREIINTYEPNPEHRCRGIITQDGFTRYLLSDENSPVFLDRFDIYMEMDHPLAHYYCNSSHNTYLINRQFGGKSSVEMYRQALLAGCRCIELDTWNGDGPDYEPIITHGRALCTSIPFKDTLVVIKECAFITSEYPVILSFENHCNKNQQYKMAKYCKEIFGDSLLDEPLESNPLKPNVPLPSPKDLKFKILIKNKRLNPEKEKVELELFLKGQSSPDDDDESEDPSAILSREDLGGIVPHEFDERIMDPSKEDVEPVQLAMANYRYTGATLKVHPLLSRQVSYTEPIKFPGFEEAKKRALHFKMSSFPETAAYSYVKSNGLQCVEYNKRQLSRIYPKWSRTDSSNFIPQVFWNVGCQMVALNFQTSDLPMQLNQGKFEYNGACGYLLKPDFMRRPDREFDPDSNSPVDGVIAAQCLVKVISGQFLTDRPVGVYVEVDMYGLPTDTVSREFRTRIVNPTGLNFVFKEDAFVFRKIVLPDLAVLRICVYDENDKVLGQRILPLDGLQAGARHVSLRTEGNVPLSLPTLFIYTDLKIYIPDELEDVSNALANPDLFLSAQEIRKKQWRALGIDDEDVVDSSRASNFIINGAGNHALNGGQNGTNGYQIEKITIDGLKREKSFKKLVEKHQKELESMRKTFERKKSQTKSPEKHQLEEHYLLKAQKSKEIEVLRKILHHTQASQLKALEAQFKQEIKEIKQKQDKVAVETAKKIANDRTITTKAERESRLKEKLCLNTKKFVEERTNLAEKQSAERDRLKMIHEKQMMDLVNQELQQ